MPYIVTGGRLKVSDETYRENGQAIPEAEAWPWQLREQYLRAGRIAHRDIVPQAPAEAKKMSKKEATDGGQ